MAFITEQATDMICKRLVDYGYEYHGQMHHKLYPVYLKVAGVIQIRLGLQKAFSIQWKKMRRCFVRFKNHWILYSHQKPNKQKRE